MGVLIDSSTLIAAERGELDLERVLADAGDESPDEIAIAAVTASELLHGVHRLTGVAEARAALFVAAILDRVPVIPFDLDVARVHALLSADLGSRGTAVGAHDLMIAATAVFLDYAVATRDRRSFPKIKGLVVRIW
jgi:predicted nucleic acid-binding protein